MAKFATRSLIFVFASFVLASCDRPEAKKANLIIKLPGVTATSKSDVHMLTTVTSPTGIGDIDCYMVAIGGPSEDLRRNRIFRSDAALPDLFVGDLVGGVPSGGNVEIETSAGPDRVIRLFGMKSQNAACKDFHNGGYNSTDVSLPFLLAEAGNINVEAGTTKTISLTRVFDANKWYDKFQGTDFGGGGGPSGPYMRFEFMTNGDNSQKYRMTLNRCYSAEVKLFQNGSTYTNTATAVTVSFGSIPFGGFYSNPSCSSSITDAVINNGSNSTGTIYFKPTVVGDLLQLSTVTHNATFPLSFQPTNNLIQIGKPKGLFIGPNRLSTASPRLCANYKVRLESFEGEALNTHAGYNFTVMNNASFNIGPTSCNNSTSLTVPSNQVETSFTFELISGIPIDLASLFSDPAVDFASFVVTNGNGKAIPDALTLDFTLQNNRYGECAPMILRLVNADGSAAEASDSFEVSLTPTVQGQGMFFSDANCSASLDSVNFNSGGRESSVYFKAYGPNNTITVKVGSARIRLLGASPGNPSTKNFAFDATDPYTLRVHPPSFNGATIVGNHEFDETYSKLYFPLVVGSQLTTLMCNSNCNSAWVACDYTGTPPNLTLKVPYGNLAPSSSLCVTANYPNSASRSVTISATNIYGPFFNFMNCNATAGAGGGQTIANLNASFAGYTVTCLPANTTYYRTANGESYVMGTDKSLIGHSSGTSILNGNDSMSNPYTGSLITTSTDLTSAFAGVANVKFENIPGNAAGILVASPTASTGSVFFLRNLSADLTNTSASLATISDSTNVNMNFDVRNLKASALATTSAGLKMTCASRVKIFNSLFETKHSSALGLDISHGCPVTLQSLYISSNKFSGIGVGIKSYATQAGFTIYGTQIVENLFDINNTFGVLTSSSTGVALVGKNDMNQIRNNFFIHSSEENIYSLVELSPAISGYYPTVVNISGNSFVASNSAAAAIRSRNLSGDIVTMNPINNNSFSFIGSSPSGNSIFMADGKHDIGTADTNNSKCGTWDMSWTGQMQSSGQSFASAILGGALSTQSYRCVLP